MYRKIVNYLRGEVAVRCCSAAPERVLNLCSVHNIPFWDVVWEDAAHIRFKTTIHGRQALRQVMETAAVEVEELSLSGAPVMLKRLRRRYVLLVAAALALIWLWCGANIVLGFSISGNERVSDTEILRALERNGVTVGTRALEIEQETLRNHVLLELHELSWLSVNVRGCTAHVQVVERQRPPRIIDPQEYANVVSTKAGLVTEIVARNGKTCVAEGEMVEKGQLLLSGVSDGRFGGVRFMHAHGEVWGRTWYTLTVRVPLTVVQQVGEGQENHHFSLLVGKKRINFYGKGSILTTGCDRIALYHPLRLPFGGELPLSLCHEKLVQYDVQEVTRTEEAALNEGKLALLQRLTAQLTEGGSVTWTTFTHRMEGDTLVVTLGAECLEQLGAEVPVLWEKSETKEE